MSEAVGESFWPLYFRTLRRGLAPGAQALVQSITIDDARFAAYRVRAQGFDGTFIRTWRLYLDYCDAGFSEGQTDVRYCVIRRAH